MSGWGCPHETKGLCDKVKGKECSPGMKGCIMHGRFRFASPEKNAPESVRRRLKDANNHNKDNDDAT
ncbi:hypothetical protein MTBLM1_30269 [Rhodospirillaceae bacterium LM-1]|nr:hypothetical protein MTBLM1_30269 [Rhodospirillaceae bacterium LM-1]